MCARATQEFGQLIFGERKQTLQIVLWWSKQKKKKKKNGKKLKMVRALRCQRRGVTG